MHAFLAFGLFSILWLLYLLYAPASLNPAPPAPARPPAAQVVAGRVTGTQARPPAGSMVCKTEDRPRRRRGGGCRPQRVRRDGRLRYEQPFPLPPKALVLRVRDFPIFVDTKPDPASLARDSAMRRAHMCARGQPHRCHTTRMMLRATHASRSPRRRRVLL